MKDLIIKIEKRAEELCTQTWVVTGQEARQVLLDEIRWLESLLPDMEKMLDKQA